MYHFLSPEAFTTEYYLEKYTPDEDGTEDEKSFRLKLENEVSDRVIIPKIGAEIEIFRNMDEKQALSRGAWVVPGSVKAEKDGEIYITGHRFAVVPPAKNTFYNLDQLSDGDEFFLIEDGYLYKYTVEGTKVVDPQEVSFDENPVGVNKVVLYTCTPLWTSSKRLLVKSEQTYF